MRTLLTRLTALTAVGLFGLTACTTSTETEEPSGDSSEIVSVEISAAASLTDVIDALETEYQKENENFELAANLAASSKLVQQINEGQTSELLITADEAAIETLDASLNYTNEGRVVTNQLVLAVTNEWAQAQEDEASAANVDYILENASVAICAPEVPCGRNTQLWLEANGQEDFSATTEEDDVRNTLSKAVSGEVDAAFVYATDQATATDTTTAVALPGAEIQGYPLLVSPDASDAALEFTAWLQEDEAARAIFTEHGFGAADAE